MPIKTGSDFRTLYGGQSNSHELFHSCKLHDKVDRKEIKLFSRLADEKY